MSDTEAELEREVQDLERRVRGLRTVMDEATREVAKLEGIGGTLARWTGTYEERIEAAMQAAAAARADLEECVPALSIAREMLTEARQAARKARDAEEATRREVLGPEEPDRYVDPRFAHIDVDTPDAEARVRALEGAQLALRQLESAIQTGLQVSQDAAVHHVKTRRKKYGGGMLSLHHRQQLEKADTRVAAALDRLQALLRQGRLEGWEPRQEAQARPEGLLALLADMRRSVGLWGARDKHTELLELQMQLAILEELIERALTEARSEAS